MITTTYKQTGIRLPENLILGLKKNAAKKGLSFNAYVISVLQEKVQDQIPFIDNTAPLPKELLFDNYPDLPSNDEIRKDSRYAAALGV